MAAVTNSKKPANSKFKQQKLPAWKPVLTPSSVLPTFFGVGTIFTIIGAVLLAQTDDLVELELDYTDCVRKGHTGEAMAAGTCADLLASNNSFTDTSELWNRCECVIDTKLEGFAGKDVYIYYGMENYYQNHRRYVKSRSDAQLRSSQAEGSDECDPLEKTDDGSKYYAPCGLIANSLFNDTIEVLQKFDPSFVLGSPSGTCTDTLPSGATTCEPHSADEATCVAHNDGSGAICVWTPVVQRYGVVDGTPVEGITGCGIAWDSDKEVKFKNPIEVTAATPALETELLCNSPLNSTDSVKPPNWAHGACELGDRSHGVGVNSNTAERCNTGSSAASDCYYNPWDETFGSCGLGYQNEDFIVWMRTAALPTFRKLYRKIPGGIPDDEYSIRIGYNYPVKDFNGVKKLYFSTTSSVGGKSWFLPAMYLVLGIMSFLAGAVFLILQQSHGLGRKLGDVSNLVWHTHGHQG